MYAYDRYNSTKKTHDIFCSYDFVEVANKALEDEEKKEEGYLFWCIEGSGAKIWRELSVVRARRDQLLKERKK